jgi:hypothetical protein
MLIDEMGVLNDEMGNAGSSHDETKPLQNNGRQYTTAKKNCRGTYCGNKQDGDKMPV